MVIQLCWLGVLWLSDLRQTLPGCVWLCAIAFVAYLTATWLVLSGRARPSILLVVGAAAIFRLTLLAAPPTLSDDLYRSVWEGRVLANGFSPYRYAPDAPELAHLRDQVWDGVNNKDIPSPYPPLAQVYSLVTNVISPAGVFGPKLASAVLDGLLIVALIWSLRRRGQLATRSIVYAWAPLPTFEFAHSGHNDALMVLVLVLALALLSRPLAGPALLAAAVLSKIAPLALVPLLARARGVRGALLFGGLVAAGYVPLVLLGGGATGSLGLFAVSWSDNDSAFFVLKLLVYPFVSEATSAAKLVSLLLLVGGAATVALHPRFREWSMQAKALAILGWFLILSSTVHAWYLTWLLPLIAHELHAASKPLVFRPLWVYAWLLFSGLVTLPYLTYSSHQWQIWISAAEYAPLYWLLAVALWQATYRRTWRVPSVIARLSAAPAIGERERVM